jgi:tripartite-type tricarboxylate transporter receptor subunit TctC
VPADVIARLNRDINKALAVASVKARFLDVGGEAAPMSPAEFKASGPDSNAREGTQAARIDQVDNAARPADQAALAQMPQHP